MEQLEQVLKSLKLPSIIKNYRTIGDLAAREDWDYYKYLQTLMEEELRERAINKVNRLLRSSKIPLDKTMESLNIKRLTKFQREKINNLKTGKFISQSNNILVFGPPGLGKTHIVCAIGNELIKKGISVLFLPAYLLIQQLLKAKKELVLEKLLKKLDRIEVIILDDIGYIQQSREEMEVLFTFLAERYERKSLMITSNLVFSQWDKIFKDPMTTAAAIDRLIHHSITIELKGESYRAEFAKNIKNGEF